VIRWRAALALLALSSGARAQYRGAADMAVGSERELYQRVVRLALTERPDAGPWAAHMTATPKRVRLLRPALTTAFNSTFPWQADGGAEWRGKGLTVATTVGVAATFWKLSAQFEPVAFRAWNAPFELDNTAAGFRDPMRPETIDLPQRMGDASLVRARPGESYVRLDAGGFGIGLSTERLFWGAGVRNAVLFSGSGPGFPHLFLGTTTPAQTPVGELHARIVYGRLDGSEWSPPTAEVGRRFGSGVLATWTPPAVPIEFGAARFYHRPWKTAFRARDFGAPFGSFFYDDETFAGDVPDNQLAVGFLTLRLDHANLEVFGEFARNDRSQGKRDLYLEPEHNSAWLLGFLKAFAIDTGRNTLWSLRFEAATGRISAIQSVRLQSTFYEHGKLAHGHTHDGRLLGTPLIDRAGGSELAVDRWSPAGRLGVSLFQRQMPPEITVGLPASRARTQWDARVGGVRFIGNSELSLQLGVVLDLDRFPGRDLGNLYAVTGWRVGLRH
jgi:hypothetical protein